ncbi:MAG: stage III sporulation protein AF [Pelosinus sp.]|nr:stage III sporulation protein AF [Pelosinus sp.]
MGAVTIWVKNIILVILFASFTELLLPNTSMKRFIRVIMGIFIMLAILNPILYFFQTEQSDEHIAVLGAKDELKNSKTDSINQVVDSTVTKRDELMGGAYREDLARQMSAVVKSTAGVEDAHAKVSIGANSKISKVIIYVKPRTASSNSNIKIDNIIIGEPQLPELQGSLTEKVKQTVSELYQIPPQNIEIEPLS